MTSRVTRTLHSIHDRTTGFKSKIQGKNCEGRELCHECEKIPFEEFSAYEFQSPTGSTSSTSTTFSSISSTFPAEKFQTYCIALDKVLSNRKWCKFCALLFDSVCRPEYDLLKPDHISKHLQSSDKLKDIKTFSQWVEAFSSWEKWTEGEDIWPFGYSRDQKEAQADAEANAMKQFQSAEDKDLKSGVLHGKYDTKDEISTALQAVAFTAGMAEMIDTNRVTGGAFASLQLVSSQMAMFNLGKAKRLPCLFLIRPYQRDEAKAGVLSIRVFAHGRGFHASLKEICHFSFRMEQPNIRPEGQQIWYGRALGPRIDLPFFEHCLVSCQQLHGDACNVSPWRPSSNFKGMETFPFRLINVQTMQILEKDFNRVRKPIEDPEHISFVALSYTWGASEWTEHIDSDGHKYYYNSHTNVSTYNRVGHTRLTRANLNILQRPGSLTKDDVYIPKTIQDAIEVCRKMNERYLWVDSLCVIQDEDDPANISNISHMGQIYGEAIFTIVAGDAKTADSGMNGISTDRVVSKQLMDTILGKVHLFLPVEMKQNFDPWETRAWTFQEKLFSRRMLMVAGGYAIWRCRGATWREDVNALDCNDSTSFPWPQLIPENEHNDSVEDFCLRSIEEDESIRLYRSLAFCQYSKIVDDFSGRIISEPWKIIDAFEGLQKTLESPKMLNSLIRFGLPTRLLHVALLWQPSGPTRRREHKIDGNGNVLRLSPPSWSWAGWVASGKELNGAKVSFETPFEVMADENGLLMRPNLLGEERVRPLHRNLYGVTKLIMPSDGTSSFKLVDFGLLNQRNLVDKVSKDWESFVQKQRPEPPPRCLDLSILNDQHLVFHTEVASLWLGNDIFRVKTRTKAGGTEFIRETIEHWHPVTLRTAADPELEEIISVSKERQILDGESSKPVGLAKLNSGEKPRDKGVCESVIAMVLSEAQYMGHETRVDVLGYPVYNIMVITKKPNGFYERIGLGKIYKHAWKRTAPKREVVVLE